MSSVSGPLASMLSTCTMCHSWAEQDEGPYHRNAQPLRRDIVEDRDGIPLQLGLRLARHGNVPVPDATVEIWQCDALGRYSGFPPPHDPSLGSSEESPPEQYLRDQTFLRGRQRSDAAGMVEFLTIYPGWYPGRTVHIHLMAYVGATTLTSQLYFPDDVSDHVLSITPYAERPGRDTTNDTDGIFPTGGDPAVLDVTPAGSGFRAAICLVLPALPDEEMNGSATTQARR